MQYVLLFTLVAAATAYNPLDGTFDPDLDQAWDDFKNMFSKFYDEGQDLARRINFEQAVSLIKNHNLGVSSYKLGINKYSDLSPIEIASNLLGFKGPNPFPSSALPFSLGPSQPSQHSLSASTPSSMDWVKKGYVTPVKDQADCGSCYAFSATGALEAQFKKKTGQLVSLSEQNIIDCSQSEGNTGCDGGWMNQAFKYVKTNGGIDTEDSYPYADALGNCSYTPSNSIGTVTGYVNIPSGDEKALMKAVATVGPVSVAINADGDFPYYESGIYEPAYCPNTIYDVNHAPLLVGYGREDGKDFWLVKNSWGESWGIKGYIKMARNKNNLCGIATKASYPLVA